MGTAGGIKEVTAIRGDGSGMLFEFPRDSGRGFSESVSNVAKGKVFLQKRLDTDAFIQR